MAGFQSFFHGRYVYEQLAVYFDLNLIMEADDHFGLYLLGFDLKGCLYSFNFF